MNSVAAVTLVFCLLAFVCPPNLPAQSQAKTLEGLFHEGTEAVRAGNLDQAAQDFSAAAKMDPSFAEASFNLGLVRMQQAHYEDAISSLNHSLALKPRLRGAHLFLGIAHYRRNEYDKAIPALKRETEIDPSSAQAFMWLGVAELAKGDAFAASAALDKAAELKPHDVDILYHRGRAHMLVSKASYEEMYKTDPNSWRVHQVLSQSYADADRVDDAIAECQLAVVNGRPNEPGLHEELGDLYWRQNQLAKAETEFQNELKADPESTESLYKLAVISLERSKTDVAAELLAQVLKRTPHSADAEYQLGRAQAQMGNVDSAVTNFQAAVTDSGKSDTETLRQSYYQLAQLYRRQQKPEESRAALDSFMRLKQQADAQQSQNLQDKLRRSAQLQQSGPSQ
jgi:tetratricopeptide (TPR) repeat protein